jgi:NTE family protein
MKPEDWMPVLKKVSFFSQFRERELALLRPKFRTLSLAAGETLFRQGDPGDSFHILLTGQIHLIQHQDGRERILAILGRRGDALGEMSLLAGEPRPATASVAQAAELLVLTREDFESILQRAPSLGLAVTRVLSTRLLQATRRPAPATEGRLFALVGALDPRERCAFAAHLALSTLEQTRRRVLLLDIHAGEDPTLASRLHLPPLPPGAFPDPEDLQSPDAIRTVVRRHGSGLEILSVPQAELDSRLFNGLYPFLNALRREWDFVFAALPPAASRSARVLWEESDRTLYVREETGEKGSPLWRDLEGAVPAAHLDLVELQRTDSPRRNRPGRYYIPWRKGLGDDCPEKGRASLASAPDDAVRGLDRLARSLAGLRIGFALGSGAALGYSLIGMLRSLERHGLYPDLLAGTSMGALIGSFYAAGHSVDEIEEISRGITKARLWAMADLALPWKGVVSGRGVFRFLKSILGEATFDTLHLPFACVATDIYTGEERVLRHGSVAEAVRASLSLPFFFEPFFLQGRYLVDGGLVNPVPTSIIKAMGADVLLSVNITTKPSTKRFPGSRRKPSPLNPLHGPSIFKVMAKTMYTMQYGIAHTGAADAHVVLSPDLSEYTWLEFHRAAEIIKIGEEYTELMMPKIQAHFPFFANHGPAPHSPA